MRWLLYGAHGWIGGQISALLKTQGEQVIEGESRVEDYETLRGEVKSVKPDRVICTVGSDLRSRVYQHRLSGTIKSIS